LFGMTGTTTKGEATRERILETAVRTASTVGLEGLSIGALARAEDMSKSGIFAHFGSKEELQIAVLEAAREGFIAAVLRPAFGQPRGEPRLSALFERWLDWEEGKINPGGCPFLMAAMEFDDRPGRVRDTVARIQVELSDSLRRVATSAIEAGHFRPDVDPVQVAFDLYGIILAFHLHHRLLERADARERARAAFRALLARGH
jgi:AcrR family transcriptional regulator